MEDNPPGAAADPSEDFPLDQKTRPPVVGQALSDPVTAPTSRIVPAPNQTNPSSSTTLTVRRNLRSNRSPPASGSHSPDKPLSTSPDGVAAARPAFSVGSRISPENGNSQFPGDNAPNSIESVDGKDRPATPLSAISVSSQGSGTRKLEWDSAADVGYIQTGEGSLSTLERMAIGNYMQQVLRTEPEGRSTQPKIAPQKTTAQNGVSMVQQQSASVQSNSASNQSRRPVPILENLSSVEEQQPLFFVKKSNSCSDLSARSSVKDADGRSMSTSQMVFQYPQRTLSSRNSRNSSGITVQSSLGSIVSGSSLNTVIAQNKPSSDRISSSASGITSDDGSVPRRGRDYSALLSHPASEKLKKLSLNSWQMYRNHSNPASGEESRDPDRYYGRDSRFYATSDDAEDTEDAVERIMRGSTRSAVMPYSNVHNQLYYVKGNHSYVDNKANAPSLNRQKKFHHKQKTTVPQEVFSYLMTEKHVALNKLRDDVRRLEKLEKMLEKLDNFTITDRTTQQNHMELYYSLTNLHSSSSPSPSGQSDQPNTSRKVESRENTKSRRVSNSRQGASSAQESRQDEVATKSQESASLVTLAKTSKADSDQSTDRPSSGRQAKQAFSVSSFNSNSTAVSSFYFSLRKGQTAGGSSRKDPRMLKREMPPGNAQDYYGGVKPKFHYPSGDLLTPRGCKSDSDVISLSRESLCQLTGESDNTKQTKIKQPPVGTTQPAVPPHRAPVCKDSSSDVAHYDVPELTSDGSEQRKAMAKSYSKKKAREKMETTSDSEVLNGHHRLPRGRGSGQENVEPNIMPARVSKSKSSKEKILKPDGRSSQDVQKTPTKDHAARLLAKRLEAATQTTPSLRSLILTSSDGENSERAYVKTPKKRRQRRRSTRDGAEIKPTEQEAPQQRQTAFFVSVDGNTHRIQQRLGLEENRSRGNDRVPGLQESLRRHRPDFISHVKARQVRINTLSHQRIKLALARRQQLVDLMKNGRLSEVDWKAFSAQSVRPAFSHREMLRQTRRLRRQLPEVQEKKLNAKKKIRTERNLELGKLYTKCLQQYVLHGQISHTHAQQVV